MTRRSGLRYPTNSPGLSLLLREPTVGANPNPVDHPVDAKGEETDQFYLFDNVFIPNELVFSVRNRALLDVYYESGAYMLWSIMMRLGFRAEIFAGVAQAITEILGTDKIPGVQAAVAEITLYAQTLRAYTVATIEESVEWCGIQVPNPPLVTAGRLYSIREYPRITYLMKDLSGQALISRWPEKVWNHPSSDRCWSHSCLAQGSQRQRRTGFSASSGIWSVALTRTASAYSRTSTPLHQPTWPIWSTNTPTGPRWRGSPGSTRASPPRAIRRTPPVRSARTCVAEDPKVQTSFHIAKREPCMSGITGRDSEAVSAKSSRQKVEVEGIHGAEDI